MDFVIDTAFVIAVVAFLKERLGLTGNTVLVAAFVVVVGAEYLPDVIAMFPEAQEPAIRIVNIIKLFLAAPGTVDLVKNLIAKFSPAELEAG